MTAAQTAADTVGMATTPITDAVGASTTANVADQVGRHDVAGQAHALRTAADLVSATAIDGLSITIYDTGRISLQISATSGPAEARIAHVTALAAAFDTITTPRTGRGDAGGPDGRSVTYIEADGTLAGHRIDVFTAIHPDHGGTP